MNDRAYFIFNVRDQERSTAFYTQVFGHAPRLHVPGMTEFEIAEGVVLGLMPETGIRRLLGSALPDPANGRGAARAELYLPVTDVAAYHARAIAAGATELSAGARRSWGHWVAYSLDPDSHVLAFAKEIPVAQ